jgi:glycine/D-amino acid oxidase-like deaminating enzyme
MGAVTDAPSWWWSDLGGLPAPRPPLGGDREADVCIVGAGYTGLWTAYELRRADPSLEVVVVEREVAGFGASGRDGGWVLGDISTGSRLRAAAGEAAVAALQRAAHETVDEVAPARARRSTATSPRAARSPWPRRRRSSSACGPAGAATCWRPRKRRRASGSQACAARASRRIARACSQPSSRGLAEAAERHGATIHERTPALALEPGRTRVGSVRARWVVRATEGYTGDLPGRHRTLLALSSSMIVTEPLDAATWAQIGWEGRETIDAAHAYCYLQRTADDRIAIGGRGRPYRFGSSTDHAGEIPTPGSASCAAA